MESMMIEILNRYNREILYTSPTANNIAEAVTEANFSGANLSGADLQGVDLQDAILRGAELTSTNFEDADLRNANLQNAELQNSNFQDANLKSTNFRYADLQGANLRYADLRDASLQDANLKGAELKGAKGINPNEITPLLMLFDQPGKIRAYKLVNEYFDGPYTGGIEYALGNYCEVLKVNTNTGVICGEGINVATLDWCMKHWQSSYRIMIVEFEAKDIAAIPTATDGKFRLYRCNVVGEKDLKEIGLTDGD